MDQKQKFSGPILQAMTREKESGGPILVPFLKWAGGKRWLTTQYSHLFPKKFVRYVEPFLGSGAVFFHLRPNEALLSDSNPELINAYAQIRMNWGGVRAALQRHHRSHNEAYYYIERSRRHRVAHEQAAQFIYLNRTCWNALYRVNLRGVFNVPIGTKTAVILSTDDFERVASVLKKVELSAVDFEQTLSKAREGDFVFVDPPYVTRHNFNGFAKYNDKIFSWEDQERLSAAVAQAASRGAKLLVTNADHESVRALYRQIGSQIELRRQSVLAADSNNRGATTEIAIVINYDIMEGSKRGGASDQERTTAHCPSSKS